MGGTSATRCYVWCHRAQRTHAHTHTHHTFSYKGAQFIWKRKKKLSQILENTWLVFCPCIRNILCAWRFLFVCLFRFCLALAAFYTCMCRCKGAFVHIGGVRDGPSSDHFSCAFDCSCDGWICDGNATSVLLCSGNLIKAIIILCTEIDFCFMFTQRKVSIETVNKMKQLCVHSGPKKYWRIEMT